MLITEAPLSTALAIALPEAAQVIVPSPFVFGTVASGTLSARAPGHTPRIADPVLGRRGDRLGRGAVRVGHRRAGDRRRPRIPGPLRVGEVGGGVDRARSAGSPASPAAGRQLRRGDLRAPVVGRRRQRVARDRLELAQQHVGLGVDQQAALAQGAREGARVAARDLVAAEPDVARRGSAWRSSPTPCRARRRRSRCQDPHAPTRPSRRRAAASAGRPPPRRAR